MKVLANELLPEINRICAEYHFFKQTNVIEKVTKIQQELQQYITFFLQGDVFGLGAAEYNALSAYALQVLRDYSEAYINRDAVWMVDTLEHGVRKLVQLLAEEGIEES